MLCRSETWEKFSANRLHDRFNIKIKTNKDYEHNVICYTLFPHYPFQEDYTVEIRQVIERYLDHSGWHKSSHICGH